MYYINDRKVIKAPEGFTHAFKAGKHRGKAYEHIVVASNALGRDIYTSGK